MGQITLWFITGDADDVGDTDHIGDANDVNDVRGASLELLRLCFELGGPFPDHFYPNLQGCTRTFGPQSRFCGPQNFALCGCADLNLVCALRTKLKTE